MYINKLKVIECRKEAEEFMLIKESIRSHDPTLLYNLFKCT